MKQSETTAQELNQEPLPDTPRAKRQKHKHDIENPQPISVMAPAEEEPELKKKGKKRKRLQRDEEDEEWKHDDEVKPHFPDHFLLLTWFTTENAFVSDEPLSI